MSTVIAQLFTVDEKVEETLARSLQDSPDIIPCDFKTATRFCGTLREILRLHYQMIRLMVQGRPRSWEQLRSILNRLVSAVDDVASASIPVVEQLAMYDTFPEMSPYADMRDGLEEQISSRVTEILAKFVGDVNDKSVRPIVHNLADIEEEVAGAVHCIIEVACGRKLDASDYLWLITQIKTKLFYHAVPNHVLDISEKTPGLLTLLDKMILRTHKK